MTLPIVKRRHSLLASLRVRAWKTSTRVDQALFGEAADTIEELVGALKEAREQVVGFMLECGHSAESAIVNVARLDAALAKARGEQ